MVNGMFQNETSFTVLFVNRQKENTYVLLVFISGRLLDTQVSAIVVFSKGALFLMKRRVISTLIFLAFCGPAFSENVNPLSLGISDYRDESYEEAIDSLRRTRSEQPASFEAALYLGLSYKAVQDFTEARKHLNDAVRLRPASAEAHFSLAETLYHLGEYDEALKELEAAKSKKFKPGDTLFLKGLVLMKKGRNEEAVSSFTEAKKADSRLAQAADFQAGLAFISAKRYDEALKSLQEAAVKDPATDLAQYAAEYARTIARKKEREKPLRLSAGFRLEYDDNVILKPADAAAAAGITGEEDYREVVTFRAEHTKKTGGPWSVRTSYSLYATNQHQLESHEVISNTLGISPSYDVEDGSIALSLTYNNTLVENSLYLDSITLAPSWSHILGADRMMTVSARLQKREFHNDPFSIEEDRDSVDYGLGAGYYRFFTNGGFLSFKYEINKENSDGANWDYLGNRASVNVLYPMGERLKLQAFTEALIQDFSNTNTFFAVKREDKVFTASALVAWSVSENADLMVQYTHVRDDSNIAIYDYDRDIFSAGIDYRF